MNESTAIENVIKGLPKVLLHDHLDGGLRPETIIELAADIDHKLPQDDPLKLGEWFVAQSDSGSLESYLETFVHTVAVMQTASALERVAREAVEDLAADGVVLAEIRYAPEQHVAGGLSLDEVVTAVQTGLTAGVAAVQAAGGTMVVGQILCAMRHQDRFLEIAELALRHRDRGVVAFDLAGPEDGFLPSRASAAFELLRDANFPTTIHAGEAAGAESISEAVHLGGACRLGHGTKLVEQFIANEWSALAHWVRDRRIALESCPTSNLQTGVVESIALHPVTTFLREGFAVTVNTDNRLQSGTSLTRELSLLVAEAGWTLDDVRDVTITAAWASFCHHDERKHLIYDVIGPGHVPEHKGRHRR